MHNIPVLDFDKIIAIDINIKQKRTMILIILFLLSKKCNNAGNDIETAMENNVGLSNVPVKGRQPQLSNPIQASITPIAVAINNVSLISCEPIQPLSAMGNKLIDSIANIITCFA